MQKQREPQCSRCGQIYKAMGDESFLETPCNHLFCSSRPLFRHELNSSTASKEDQFLQIVTNTRRRVCTIMNKERSDFQATPAYDEFLELREDTVTKFIELYDPKGALSRDSASAREDLEKQLHKFEVDNQEQIIRSRATAEDRKRRKIEYIIETEGTLFDRINADYHERESVIDHELAVQYAELLSSKAGMEGKFSQHASADLLNRRTRMITTQPASHVSPSTVPQIAEASGCKDIWKSRALSIILEAFS